MFDIKQMGDAAASREEEGVVVHVTDAEDTPQFYDTPEGERLPVTITVAGAHSTRFRRVEENIRQRKLKPSKLTGQAIYMENIEKAAACTLAWQGFVVNDQPIRCDAANAKVLYMACPWVYDQVLEAMHDHARFFGHGSTPPATTSPSTPS